MKNSENLVMRISVDRESLLGRLANVEKMANALRFETMHLRELISCTQPVDANKQEPEA